jgi:LAO/AO transport system kinase
VVNKADRPGADQARAELTMLQSLAEAPAWQPPLVATIATRGEGVPALADAIAAHRAFLAASPEGPRRAQKRARAAVLATAHAALAARLDAAACAPAWQAALADVAAHQRSPVDVAAELLAALGLGGEA